MAPLDEVGAGRVLDALLACPHGVLAMSPAIPGLVETSNNLAKVTTAESGEIQFTNLARSSSRLGLAAVVAQTAAVLRLAGVK